MSKPMILGLFAFAFVLALMAPQAWADGQLTLVNQGQPKAVILLPDAPGEIEKKAAEELAEHLKLIAGQGIAVQSASQPVPDGMTAIHLGQAADAALDAVNAKASDDIAAFTLRVGPGRIDIRGQSESGTLFGVYELLEQLGVRWYMPGEFGRVVPRRATVAVDFQQTTQFPSFGYRNLQHIARGDWTNRARLNLEARVTGGHGLPGLGKNLFETHPEWFSLINGKRQFRQHCISNPQVLEHVVATIRKHLEKNPAGRYVSLGPRDGGGFCECENCAKLDQGVLDPTANRISMTDRYIWFINRVLEEMPEYPDLHIVMYVYGATMMPPAIKPNPRFVGVLAPITIDRIRGMDNPMSPDRHILRWLLDEWGQRGLDEMYFRGYYNNLACPQFPLSQVATIRNETPAFKAKGITAMRAEVIRPSWATCGLNLYLASRLMWNADADVDALLEEFYTLFHGQAARPMQAYYEALDDAFANTPYFTGSSYPYLVIFDHARRDRMRQLLDEAARLVDPQSMYAQRIGAVRLGWDRMEAFLDLMAARNRHDFKTAYQLMQKFDQLSDQGANVQLAEFENARERDQPRLIHLRERSDSRKSYFTRFFRQPVLRGYERTVEQGKLLAGMEEQWDFLLDPTGIGMLTGYWRPGRLGGNWQPLHTTARSWSDQGLHYYKGVAWYRQEIVLPAVEPGQRVYLWFGGVDRVATVWVNGKLLGTSREPNEGLPGVPGSFRPFDMDATAAILPGQKNTVVVRILNDRLSELGTGGIVAPVMFWTPNDPDWKP